MQPSPELSLRHIFHSTVTDSLQPLDCGWCAAGCDEKRRDKMSITVEMGTRTRCCISQQDPSGTLTTSWCTKSHPHPPKLEPQPHQFPQSPLPSADIDPSWHLCTATISPLVFSSPNPSFFHLSSLSHPLSVTDCELFWIHNPNGSAYVYANVFPPVLGPTSLSLWTISCILGPNDGEPTDPTNWHRLNQQREAQSKLDYKLRCPLMQIGVAKLLHLIR